jgi:hypothetical protein
MGKMIKKIHKASVWFVLLCSISLHLAGCARNTLGEQYDDGRVYFIIDLNPDWFFPNGGRTKFEGYVEIRYTIEGEEPVVSEEYQYSIKTFSGQRFELVGKSIEGGLEVRVTAVTNFRGVDFYISIPTFRIDGNVTLRFRLEDQTNRDSSLILVME